MVTRLRRRLSLPVLAVAAALIAACGSSGGSKAATGEATTTTTTAAAAPDASTPAGAGGPTATTAASGSTSATTKATARAASVGTSSTTTTAKKRDPVTVRLGYFPNITHATAIVGVEGGYFQKALGADKLQTSLFNAGPAATEALFSGALDATYIGPSPTINAYAQSNGSAVRIVAGATTGGAMLIVKPDINSAADLKGKKVASPQLGNTQDVSLRFWLSSQGLKTDTSGGGDVSIVPQDNSQTLQTFKQGSIQGAWVPEPWATRLVQQAGGKVLVDERDLWPKGQFVTTHLIVRTQFLKDHPDVVRELLEGQVQANDFIAAHPTDAQQLVDAGIAKVTGTDVGLAVISAAWPNMAFVNDPVASSLDDSAKHAVALGFIKAVDLKGIYDLTLLNQVLAAHNQPAVGGL